MRQIFLKNSKRLKNILKSIETKIEIFFNFSSKKTKRSLLSKYTNFYCVKAMANIII
jgi:hypothetical protein